MSFPPGHHSATHAVASSKGCWDTIRVDSLIHVRDTLPPSAPRMKRVSVNANSSVLVEWTGIDPEETDHLVLSRKKSGQSSFQPLIKMDSTNTRALVDTGLNTLQNRYSYKLLAHDVCNLETPQMGDPHTTINAEAHPVKNRTNRITWTQYEGASPKRYIIFRSRGKTGKFQPLTSVSPGKTVYFDTTATCSGLYAYRIKAVGLDQKPLLHSWSDTARSETEGVPDSTLTVRIKRTTVIGDENVLTEWEPPIAGQWAIEQYKILRKKGKGGAFRQINTVPAPATSYTDTRVNVQEQHYRYKIQPITRCKAEGKSGVGSSILLKGDRNENRTLLQWTPYLNWSEGVDKYKIQIKRPDGTWETIKTVGGKTTETEVSP